MSRAIVDSSTLKNYIKLLKHGNVVGVREAQRLLNLNSPGKAQRFLERLVKAGLARKNEEGKYELIDKPFNLAGYIIIRGLIVPKVFIGSIFAVTVACSYAAISNTDLITKLILVIVTIPYWLLTIDTLKTSSEFK